MNLLPFRRSAHIEPRRFAVSVWLPVALMVGVLPSALQAASSTASLAIESLSTSFGVSSNAISGSSNSVSSRKAQVAQGEYRVADVRAVPEREQRRVALEPLRVEDPAAAAWQLTLPRQVAEGAGLAPGAVLTVAQHPYGVSVARAGEARPFYLVLHDAWAEGLAARPVAP